MFKKFLKAMKPEDPDAERAALFAFTFCFAMFLYSVMLNPEPIEQKLAVWASKPHPTMCKVSNAVETAGNFFTCNGQCNNGWIVLGQAMKNFERQPQR